MIAAGRSGGSHAWCYRPACLDADALRIEALIALVDKVVLSAPSDPAEAFRWELHPYGDDAVVPGYDVWTVRAAPDRIVVVRSVAGPSC